MSKVKVNLAQRSYSIVIGSGILRDIGQTLKKKLKLSGKILVVTTPSVKRLHWFDKLPATLARSGYKVDVVEVPTPQEFRKRPDLEEFKNNRMVMRLYDRFLEAKFRLDRTSTVIAVGGGVTGDLVAFAASTYMRGINLIHVPTTLLAQVDSAIGGKTGLNLTKGKNLVGTFYQPRLVCVDIETLNSKKDLEKLKSLFGISQDFWSRELRGGFAEIIKYGVIKDRTLFYLLERNLESIGDIINIKNWNQHRNFLRKVITRCCQIKAWVVQRDECETKGEREILNYGHTVGHALEAAGGYKLLHHGEAVSVGMVAAARIAEKLGILGSRDFLRQENLLRGIGLPTSISSKELNIDRVINAIKVDKKIRGGRLRFVLPRKIGEVTIRHNVPFGLIRSVLKEIIE